MKEFMIFVKKAGQSVHKLSEQQQQEHVRKVGKYIGELVEQGRMKEAQPLEMKGAMLSGTLGELTDEPFVEEGKVISGFYHLLAEDLEDAVNIAKADPRFEDGSWQMEIRPILNVEGIN